MGPSSASKSSGRFGAKTEVGWEGWSSQVPPLNVFVPLRWLQVEAQRKQHVNMLLVGQQDGSSQKPLLDAANEALAAHWELADANVSFHVRDDLGVIDLTSTRVFRRARS